MSLKIEYNKNIGQIKKDLNLDNVMQVPKILGITINMGLGNAINDKKTITKCYRQTKGR